MSSTTLASEADLAHALEVTTFLSKEGVLDRAHLLHKDLTRLQIEGFRLLPVKVFPGSDTRPEIRIAEYEFGPVSFSLENAKDPAHVRENSRRDDGHGD